MPGFGIQNGTSNAANYNGQTIGINANGDAGSQSPLNNAYSYNGLPSNTLDITADGAHVSDPGCNCDTPVNPNSDMISEIQVKMSNFSAENQKGPAVITSVAKSGGKDFHGSGFFYARNYAMNANDALFNASGQYAAERQVLLPRIHHRRTGTDPRHALQQEPQQAVLLYRIRVFLPGSGYRFAACDGAHFGGNRRQLLAVLGGPGRKCHRIRCRSRINSTPTALAMFPNGGHSHQRDRQEHAVSDESVSRPRTPTPTPTADTITCRRKRSIRTTCSGCPGWTIASATTPSCSSATTSKKKSSSSR